jgi:hypothetical protein
MAEIKNSFLQSKMNKDLDDRLIPNGQYRDALNIEVGKSEQDDIGALQNALGNYKLPLSEEDEEMTCIGFFMDSQNNRIYRFLTNYLDPDPSNIILPETGEGHEMRITVFDFNTQTYTILVQGLFLNFATNKDFLIIGVNLIENLLFWTDNRNQPRKINVALANPNNVSTPTYYTKEMQISVAKYAPIEPISMLKKAFATVIDRISANEFELDTIEGIVVGMTVVAAGLNSCEYAVITEINDNTITLYANTESIDVDDKLTFLISTMSDKSNDPNWPGDPDFLEDKYVRFSYRFRYDDGEYSLMAPFTQIAYIPRQKGYFVSGDENNAFRSTIIRWMENNINNIELLVPLPDTGSNINPVYKIKELDILYKESDSAIVKVLESVPFQVIAQQSPDTNIYIQPYQSQKPYKTLTEEQTVRVYDRVPVRSLAQETSGNRIIYGNYYDMYSAPSTIDYNVTIQPKSNFFTNFIEYPNHTLKQNRNYQVGFILADKFGRQSSVILSTVDLQTREGSGLEFGGSTIYSPYYTPMQMPEVKCWFGNALLVLVNTPIASTRSIPNGTPGLYAESTGGFTIDGTSSINGNQYDFQLDDKWLNNPPVLGGYLRGEYTDYVEVVDLDTDGINYSLTTTGQVNNIYQYNSDNPIDTKYAYTLNQIGWYSYKIVVKQQEQDYYNAYLPGILNDYPISQTSGSQVIYTTGVASLQNGINTSDFPVGEKGKTAHVVLINDNINKIPRDLAEVGPDQKQYRSSVELFGRVENYADTIELTGETPTFSGNITYLFYKISTQSSDILSLVTAGNGIQSVQANELHELNSTYNSWYGNTVVVSNEIDLITDPTGDTGKIIFSPANLILDASVVGPSVDFIITRAENKQYYPSKKADIVSTIASATDFGFVENTVNNIRGTAALNLYQLQTHPLIGRISTSNSIGAKGDSMIPFLGVYETKPDYSLLDLFWETASTGLISDLNYDILTGSDLPSGFSDIGFIFYENQDKNGDINNPTGAADSPWITDDFFPINATGVNLLGTTATLVSVFNNTSPAINMTNRFILDSGTTLGSYRVKINDSFVFNNNAIIQENYIFTLSITYAGNTVLLSFNGRLRNNEPLFNLDPIDYNRTISRATTSIVSITANNGSISQANTDLTWEIIAGNALNYFSINPATGLLSLINTSIPFAAYPLTIKITDAVSFAYNPPQELSGSGFPYYDSLSNTIDIIITVGVEHVNQFLYDFAADVFVWKKGQRNGVNCDLPVPYGYGAVYVGVDDVTLDANGRNPNLPIPPDSNDGRYQKARNVEVANGAYFPFGAPQGLVTGELIWTVTINARNYLDCGSQDAHGQMILYYRATANDIWAPVLDNNQVGNSITPIWATGVGEINTSGVGQGLRVEIDTETSPYIDGVNRSTSFITSIPGEYCLVVRIIDDSNGCCMGTGPNTHGAWLGVRVTDANYTSPIAPTVAYKYNLGLTEAFSNYPSGVPYDTQNALSGFNFVATGTVIGNTSSSNTLILQRTPNLFSQSNIQLVPGLYILGDNIPNIFGGTKVLSVTGNVIIISENVSLTNNQIVTFKEQDSLLGLGDPGEVWADTNDGIHVKQFYLTSDLTTVWQPPVANKFYVFQNADRDYATGVTYTLMPKPTDKPFFSAQFNSTGATLPQAVPAYTIQTMNRTNTYGRNLSQEIIS